jgi:hypothetical protein
MERRSTPADSGPENARRWNHPAWLRHGRWRTQTGSYGFSGDLIEFVQESQRVIVGDLSGMYHAEAGSEIVLGAQWSVRVGGIGW